MTTFREKLINMAACKSALDWLGDRTEEQCLTECDRGDWLLWWFFKEHKRGSEGYPDLKTITKVKVECARLVVHLMQDERSTIALNVAWAWAHGEATDSKLQTAAYAAYAAAAAAYAAAYADADAAAAAAAADADADAAAAAYAAAYAADADAAADAYAYADARCNTLKQCADICRKYFYLPKK